MSDTDHQALEVIQSHLQYPEALCDETLNAQTLKSYSVDWARVHGDSAQARSQPVPRDGKLRLSPIPRPCVFLNSYSDHTPMILIPILAARLVSGQTSADW